MTALQWAMFGAGCAGAVWFAWECYRAPIIPGNRKQQERDAQQAADSVRQTLDADSRFDELRTYTQRPHVKAFTEPRA